MGWPLDYHGLSRYRHLVARDNGVRTDARSATIEVERRWTVSHIATSIEDACRGYGFAWLPETHIRNKLATGELALLPMAQGRRRDVDLYLIMADPDLARRAAAG